METGKAVYKLLKDSADVGAICADRVFPEMAQQDADAPFVVYTVTDTTPSSTKSGTSKLDTARVELYCIAEAYDTAMDLGIAVRTALDRQSGTISGVEVQSIDFDTSDIEFDPDQRVYVLEQTYDVRVQRTGTANVITTFPGNTFTVEEVDGDPSGAVNKLVFSNGTVSLDGNTATVTTGAAGAEAFTDLTDTPATLGTAGQVVAVNSGATALEFVDQTAASVQYHGRYDTEAETERSGATGNVEFYYTARPDGDGEAESITSDTGVTDTINRTLAYSTKFRADPDTAADWTNYTTQPADNASYATAKAALLAGLNETDATAETRGTLPLSLKMTRTTTSAVTNKLLDDYPNAAAAFSVRKLDKDYTGNCMRVRRSSDEATQDIGFDSNGDLDTAAIASFCSGAYGYVATWYDQSGNGNNATQSTSASQPMIYDRIAAAVVTENGKPAVEFDDTHGLSATNSSSLQIIGDMFASVVNNVDSVAGLGMLFVKRTDDNNREYELRYNTTLTGLRYLDSSNSISYTVANTTTQRLLSMNRDANTTVEIFEDGTSIGSNSLTGTLSSTSAPLAIGARHPIDHGLTGTIQELVLWPSDQDGASNRTGIESDIMTYFSIT